MSLFDGERIMTFLFTWPTWCVVGGLLALMFSANEIGHRFGGGRDREEPESSRTVSNSLKASIFGLVAFLLAFAFSMTASRHDARRRVVLDEANALGTCYLRAGLVADPFRERIRNTLRDFVSIRIEHFERGAEPGVAEHTADEMDRLLDELWKTVEETVDSDRTMAHTSQIIPAANEVIDLDTTRAWASRSHLHPLVFFVLVVCVLVSSLLIGHSSGQAQRRHLWLWSAFNLLFGLVLFVVLDFDRPRRGFIQVDHAPLQELTSAFGVPAKTE